MALAYLFFLTLIAISCERGLAGSRSVGGRLKNPAWQSGSDFICGYCNRVFDQCKNLTYKDEDRQAYYIDYFACMDPTLQEWKKEVGSLPDIVNDPKGSVAPIPDDGDDRGDCLDAAMDSSACVLCANRHLAVSKQFKADSDACKAKATADSGDYPEATRYLDAESAKTEQVTEEPCKRCVIVMGACVPLKYRDFDEKSKTELLFECARPALDRFQKEISPVPKLFDVNANANDFGGEMKVSKGECVSTLFDHVPVCNACLALHEDLSQAIQDQFDQCHREITPDNYTDDGSGSGSGDGSDYGSGDSSDSKSNSQDNAK